MIAEGVHDKRNVYVFLHFRALVAEVSTDVFQRTTADLSGRNSEA